MDRIPVSGLITPIFLQDQYPVIDPIYGIDGLRNLDSLTTMFNLPIPLRRSGMVVGIPDLISNTTNYYKLKPQGNGVTWSVGDTTNWDTFIGAIGSYSLTKYNISNETIDVPSDYMYVVYGNLTIGTNGVFRNHGRTVIINGTISTTGNGTYSNFNDLRVLNLASQNKYTGTCSPLVGIGYTISHNLGTSDLIYSFREGNNFIQGNVEIIDNNRILFTISSTVSVVSLNIVG